MTHEAHNLQRRKKIEYIFKHTHRYTDIYVEMYIYVYMCVYIHKCQIVTRTMREKKQNKQMKGCRRACVCLLTQACMC